MTAKLKNIASQNRNISDWMQNLAFLTGIYSDARSIDELNEQMTRRMFTVWHDHSTVASHSHFLILISIIYDPLVYLTPEEYKEKKCDRLVSK